MTCEQFVQISYAVLALLSTYFFFFAELDGDFLEFSRDLFKHLCDTPLVKSAFGNELKCGDFFSYIEPFITGDLKVDDESFAMVGKNF